MSRLSDVDKCSKMGQRANKKEQGSPCSRELPVILILWIAVDGDDADGRTWRVRDDDGLRLVTGQSRSVVDHAGGRMHWRHRPVGGNRHSHNESS